MNDTARPIMLTIAGSDSGGGAGIQADTATAAAFGCHATTVITAVTAQNTLGVRAIHAVPADMIVQQLDAVADDLPPTACKTGMLARVETVQLVATAIRERGWSHCVVDPVLVASSGDKLGEAGLAAAIIRDLMPLASCVTPNLDEAEALTGLVVRTPNAMHDAGRALLDLGAQAALIKGGHLDSDIVVDVLVSPSGIERFRRPRVSTRATHGTGCTLSAAIACGLAHGRQLHDAVAIAADYVQRAMRAAPALGAGAGPLWHGVVPRR